VVDANFNGLSQLRLNPGAVDTAGIRTDAKVATAAYGAFNTLVQWPNVLGKTQIGLMDVAANVDVGFVQDSALYGDENIRVLLRTGAGLQVHDSGVTLNPIVNEWVELKAFCHGGAGLLTTSSLFWSIRSKKGSAHGVFTPGGAVVNPTVGRYMRFDAQNGAFLIIERCSMGARNNNGL
jgi:hypothetical protein